jgi:hypothetical protein
MGSILSRNEPSETPGPIQIRIGALRSLHVSLDLAHRHPQKLGPFA